MKKPVAILAVLLAIAVALAGVFGVQKSNVSADLTGITAERDSLQAQLSDTSAKVTELEANVASLNAAAETAAADLAAAKAETETAQAKVAELEANVASLNAAVETAAADLAAAKAETETAVAKIAELEAALTAAEAPAEVPAEEPAEAPVEVPAEKDTQLAAARSYLRTMYKSATETTPVDYTVVGVLNIDNVEYPIEWTADSETVKIVYGEDKMVTIDVDEKNPEELTYVLTATLTGTTGQKAELSFKHKVPAAMILEGLSYEEIVAAAYTLEDGLALEDTQRLYGEIVKIDSAWSEEYQNITVTIQVGDLADQTIQCYRLSGEGCATLAVGDKITVEGIIKNYKGTIEFDKGCVLVGMGEIVSQAAILDAAYALEESAAMPAPTALEGKIVKINTPWSEDYKNITVTIECDGKADQTIMCYRLSGEGAEALAEGQPIAVVGTIKNYKGTIEFDQGCKLIPVGTANDVRVAIAAYALEDGLSLDKAKTITGEVVSIDSAWSDEYQNITVTIMPAGLEEYKIQCYRLTGEGADTLAVGDVITVNGMLKNYKGTIEFDKGCTIVK